MQLFTYEIMSEIIGLITRRTVMRIHRKKRPSAQLCDLHGRVHMQIFSWKDVSVCNLPHIFLCFISATMFSRSVLTTRRVHVHVRSLRDGCVHTFLTFSVMSMCNFKHITPCLSYTWNEIQTHDFLNLRTLLCMQLLTYVRTMRRTVWRIYCKKDTNLHNVSTYACVQIFTYKDVSVCNVSLPNFYNNRHVSTQISRHWDKLIITLPLPLP